MKAEQGIWRIRLLTASLLLVALCFHQAPGLVVPDTKLDLTADPGNLLARAMSIWDGNGFGQLQNQAYGYLFPIGPFHWILDAMGLPSWVVQRLWWSAVLIVALWGFWRLSSALSIGTPWTRYLGAVLFAVSPRFLSEVAVTSIEVWPMALAPWVVLPLVDPVERGTMSRLSRSALAFGLVGGVNAVATGATLVLPTLWFATRRWSARMIGQFTAWLALCVAAALWWLVPLVVLGQHSPPFLDWIEDARVTTGTASAFNAIQGTTPWLGLLVQADGPSWPAAWQFVTQPLLIVLTGTLAVVGLLGLADRRVPERPWLLASLLVGLGLVTLGYSATGSGPFVEQVHYLLDGPLAPLRNLHKFELVVRIPLLLGAVHALGVAGRAQVIRQLPRAILGTSVALLVLAAAAPAATASLTRPGGYAAIPDHWYQAARWLDDQPGDGSVLVVPAASFADFTWGSTKDEPLQALLNRRSFAVRDAVPLGSAGTTRLLDEIERRLGTGMGSTALRRALNDAGVRYIVVRNDLSTEARPEGPIQVHEALGESGIRRVASFGPPTGSPIESQTLTVDERTALPYPSVEVFDTGPTQTSRFVGSSELMSMTGAPEDVISLSDSVLDGRAAVIGSDGDALGILADDLPVVLTDGPRRREVTFGKAVANTSDVLAVDDPGRTGRRTIDYLSDDGAAQSVLDWSGIKAVRASSSASDAGASMRLGPAYGPAAALDGDPSTRWVSGTFLSAVGEWLEVEFEQPREIPSLTVELSGEPPVAADPLRVAVDTDAGSVVSDVVSGRPWSLAVPPGKSGRVRIRLVETGAGVQNGFAIAEVAIPGLEPRSRLTLPASAGGSPSVVLLRQQNPGTTGCHFVDERPLCAAAFVGPAEEATGIHRAFATTAERDYAWSGTVLPRGGTAADRLLDAPGGIKVTATSRRVPGLAGRPGAIVDSDLGTGWVAAESDEVPSLTLTLPSKRTLTGLQFLVDTALAGSRPTKVLVSTPAGEKYSRSVDAEGRVGIPPTKTKVLSVTFLEDDAAVSVDHATAVRSFLPVGVSELRLEGADDLRRPVELSSGVGTACGFGPILTVDGVRWSTRVVGTVRQALRGEPMTWMPCGADAGERVSLEAGAHLVDADATSEFTPHELMLTTSNPRLLSAGVAVGGRASSVVVGPRSEAGILITTHNFNDGWSATDGSGASLTPVRVNGWQQGWMLASGGATTVNAVFAPQRWYATGLGVGAVTWLGVVALVLMTSRQQRHRMPPLPGAPRIKWLMAGVLVSVLIVNAGLLGVAAGLTAGAVAATARRYRWVPLVGIALGLLAVLLVAARPWGSGAATLDSPLVAYAVWTAVGVTVLAPITWRRPRHAVRDA